MQTRRVCDGGFDFFGEFRLPSPLSYTIPLKGEVKRYEPDGGGVGPKELDGWLRVYSAANTACS